MVMSSRSYSIAETASTPGTTRIVNLPVVINVYDLLTMRRSNRCMHPCGIGTYHTAIQIGSHEFTYGGNTNSFSSGIYTCLAQKNENFIFRFSIPVYHEGSPEAPVLAMTEK